MLVVVVQGFSAKVVAGDVLQADDGSSLGVVHVR